MNSNGATKEVLWISMTIRTVESKTHWLAEDKWKRIRREVSQEYSPGCVCVTVSSLRVIMDETFLIPQANEKSPCFHKGSDCPLSSLP